MIEVKIVKHSAHKEQLLNLFRICFGREISEPLWDWKYVNHPLVSSEPEVIVAMENGKIVGARPFLLMEMQLDELMILAAEHCDTMVHPEYRNKGIFNKMGKYSIQYLKEHKYTITYGFPNALSRQGFLNQGYRIVAQTETLFRPVNARRLISQRTNSKLAGHVLGFAYDVLSDLRFAHRDNGAKSFIAEVFDTYQEELTLLETWKDRSKIDIVRSEANLRWRFDLHPEHAYKYILVKKEQTLVGYAVISIQEQLDGQKRGIIIDYLIKDNDTRAFLAAIDASTREMVKSGCDIIVIWAPSELAFQNALIGHLGCKSSCTFPYNKLMEYGHMDALLIDEQLNLRIDIYNKNNWRITNALADFM